MKKNVTQDQILATTVKQFALSSPDGFSMRSLAREVGVVQSVIYHYFESKEILLKAMFDRTNSILGKERAKLTNAVTVKDMLAQRVEFQLHHAQEVVAVLKYYTAYRLSFPKLHTGFVPDKAYLHIEEELVRGITEKIFDPNTNIRNEAKVMTHAINGFLLEYYPYIPRGKEREELRESITEFLWRGIPKC